MWGVVLVSGGIEGFLALGLAVGGCWVSGGDKGGEGGSLECC